MRADLQTHLERYHADALWFGDRYEELRVLYPDQWVGVYNKEVVGAHEDPECLITDLKSKNVPIRHTYFRFMSAKEMNWVFTTVAGSATGHRCRVA